MARFSTSDVFVVEFRHTDAYSYDTGSPEQMFTSRDEADAYALEMNATLATAPLRTSSSVFVVYTLAERIEMIKDACRDDARSEQRR